MGRTAQAARWAPLVLSLLLLVGLGAFGLTLVRSSQASTEAALGTGAVDKQRTVAALADQYLRLAARSALEVDGAGILELAPGSESDRRVLGAFIDDAAGFFDHAAALMTLDGQPLNVVGELPDAQDAGWGPLYDGIAQGEIGVSSLMEADRRQVVVVGVPVVRDGEPAALLLAAFRARTSPLQRYSEMLGARAKGVGMVVDAHGTVVAARDVALVGTALGPSPAAAPDTRDEPGHATVDRDGVETVVTWAPVRTGGWLLVEEEPAADFHASVRTQSSTSQLTLLGVLLVAAGLAIVLNHRTDRARRRGARRAEALVRDSNDVVTIVQGGVVTYVSPAVSRVLGDDPSEFVGQPALARVHPDDVSRVQAAVVAAADGGRQRLQARVARVDGTYCPCELVVSDLQDDPEIAGTIVSFRDITELVALHDRLSHQALHDPLTELPNRTHLERQLAATLRDLTDAQRAAVLFLDLDGFKEVNDTYGHDRGDELLLQVAGRLRQCLRGQDLVARLGGDEFVVVVAGDDAVGDAVRVAGRILDRLATPFAVGGASVEVGVSIGIALGRVGDTPDGLLRQADAAMYRAKDNGRLRWEFPAVGRVGVHEPGDDHTGVRAGPDTDPRHAGI